jgi:hypothetical protein
MAIDDVRKAASVEFEQAMMVLYDALVGARAVPIQGKEPTQEQLLHLWWAADAATSIWQNGVCANCGKPLCAHQGVEGRQCPTGGFMVIATDGLDGDPENDELVKIPGTSGWFTPRGCGDGAQRYR